MSVGRPRLFPGHCRKLWLRFLDSQWEDLQTIKDDLDKPSVADVVRDAIDDYVADYRERRVFRERRRVQVDVAVERRSGQDRRT